MNDNASPRRMTIRPLNKERMASCISEAQVVTAGIPGEAWTAENYLYDLPGKWTFSLEAVDEDNHLLGFIIASQKEAGVHIHKYAVHPSARSTGIGAELLQVFERNVKSISPMRRATLFVDSENRGAIRFYERYGFGHDGPVEGMIAMSKPLKKIVAIHQPNFFPWLGYFYKLWLCDTFIVLDNVEMFAHDAGWVKRVSVLNSGKASWVTIPLQKGETSKQQINAMRVDTGSPNYGKALGILRNAYTKHPFAKDVFPLIEEYFAHPSPYLYERNLQAIQTVLSKIGIERPLLLSSEMNVEGSKSELVANLAKAAGADVYLSGTGALNYNQPEHFSEKGIELRYYNFNPSDPSIMYSQKKIDDFVPGLSIVDALMNISSNDVRNMLARV